MTIPQSDFQKQQIIKELTSQGYDLAGDNLPVFKNAMEIVSNMDTTISLAEIAGIVSQRSFVAGLGSSASIFSTLLLPASSMIAVVDALEAPQRTYGMRAIAYTITAWAFDDPIPKKSKRLTQNRTSGFPQASQSELEALQKAWAKASKRALKTIKKIADEQNVSQEALKVVYRAIGDNDRKNLCLKIMKGFEPKISNRHARKIWVSNYKVKYPN